MFKKPTTIILGAGASYECGMPLGSILRDSVAKAVGFEFDGADKLIAGDSRLLAILQEKYGRGSEQLYNACHALSLAAGNFPSIDEALYYLGGRPEAVEIGKAAIVDAIISGENGSSLAREPQTGKPDMKKLHNTWYNVFFSMAISGLRRGDVEKIFDQVSFINFNYDRTLECFLFYALTESADVQADEAAEIVERIHILRPYGSLGSLDWRHPAAHIGGSRGDGLFEKAKRIRTFTESHQEAIQIQISQSLDRSQLVLVLGFGFHSQNMALLSAANSAARGRSREVFATAKGIHSANYAAISRGLSGAFQVSPYVHDMTAYQLLPELRPSIAAAAA